MEYKNVEPFHAYSLLVTEDCNLACKYCYEVNSSGHKKVHMTEKTADQFLTFVMDQAKLMKGKNKNVSVCFFGGEPVLAIDIIDYICTEAKKLFANTNINFTTYIITNATLMNEKIYNIFKKHMDMFTSCQLSVDGPHDIQDSNRVTKSGKGTFQRIEDNLKYWKSLFGNKLNVHGVLSKSSVGRLYESYLYFREIWELKRIWFLPCKDPNFTEEDIILYDQEMKKIYEYVMNDARTNNRLNEIEYYAPLDRCLRDGASDKPCGAGDTYCVVTSNGDIYPCHHLYYINPDRGTYLGNIFDGVDLSKKYIWSAYDNTDLVGCEDCDHPSCYRCVAENYEKYKTPFVQITGIHCKFMKIDLKYQRLIRKEIEKMGLIEPSKNKSKGAISDCVGKTGHCDIVTSLEDCTFDRGIECKQFSAAPIDFNQVGKKQEVCKVKEKSECKVKEKSECSCSNYEEVDVLVAILDEVIEVLVKYHTILTKK